MRLRSLLIGLIVIGVLLMGIVSLHAQDTGTSGTGTDVTVTDPTEPALPVTTESPEDILRMVWATLFTGAASIAGTLFVTALVNLEKVLIPASVASADTLKNVTSVVVWIGYALAIKFGLGTQAQGLAAIITPILVTATPLVAVLIGSAKLYLAAREHNTPIWGYQRP
jgi:hypothetical protein